jgi:M6 family metalloprotease-like protein
MRYPICFLILLAPGVTLATVSPAPHTVMPDHLKAQAELLRKEYSTGYWSGHMAQRHAARSRFSRGDLTAASALAPDTVNMPVLLGRYSDVLERIPAQAFQQLLFDGPNPSGTVTQFYFENSYGQTYFTGTATGWFQAPRALDYYVHDGGTRNRGLIYGGADFTIDILFASDLTVDYAPYVTYYDAQGRGHVPQLGVVHTGADAASGADNIWSHRSSIRSRLLARKNAGSDPYIDVSRITNEGWYVTNDLTPSGAQVLIDGDYALEPELSGNSNSGTAIKQIGVFAHEFGHILGLPDLYDTDGSSEGLGQWCVMASGSYGGDGQHENYPASFSAWCKEYLGWVTPVVVPAHLKAQTVRNVEDHPEIYKLWRPGYLAKEYFLVENRQQVRFDSYLPSSGLLIYHVDNNKTNNRDENHYWVDLEQADGLRSLNLGANRGDAGDPFPGSTNNHLFDGFSKPSSNDYTSAPTYVAVRNISNSDMIMTADFDVGTRPFLVLNSATLLEGAGSNNNGRVEPGEEGRLELQLENIYPSPGSDITLAVQSATDGARTDTSFLFSIAGLTKQTLSLEHVLHVAPSFVPREISFGIQVTTPEETFSFTSSAIVGYPPILLVDRDSTQENIMQYYRRAIDAYGSFYEPFRTQDSTFSAAAIDKRKILIWFTGRKKSGTLPDSGVQALTRHINRGGHLVITGQNIAEDLQAGRQQVLKDMFHLQWSKNVAIGRTVFGVPGDFLGAQTPKLVISGSNGASNQTSPDEITPDSVAQKAFWYNSSTGPSVAGAWYEHPVSHAKVLFLGFGFEAINDSSTGISRQTLMSSILNWFRGSTTVPGNEPGSELARAFFLGQNYPNPFNPTTVISYQLPVGSDEKLVVYDVLGREVATLVSGATTPGRHEVVWDGRDSAGRAVASGIYFTRLSASTHGAGDLVQVRKMLLLK